MKIAIIGVQNLKHMTSASIYYDFFAKNNIKYDLIYIDKYNESEKNKAENVYKMVFTKEGKLFKIIKSLLFVRFVKKIISTNDYDYLIIWRESTVFLLSHFLTKRYKKKYCVNIRDLWDMNNHFMTRRIKNACLHSTFNTVCSDGFLKHLPFASFLHVPCVNFDVNSNLFSIIKNNSIKYPIVISNIGTFRNDNYHFSFVLSLKNDNRFILKYIGQGSNRMELFCKKNGINNVFCEDSFDPKDTLIKFSEADLINCSYGNVCLAETEKLPIRFYYAIFMNKICLCNSGTWVNTRAQELSMGIEIPTNFANLGDLIVEKLEAIDFLKMKKSIFSFKETIKKELNAFEDTLSREFLECQK